MAKRPLNLYVEDATREAIENNMRRFGFETITAFMVDSTLKRIREEDMMPNGYTASVLSVDRDAGEVRIRIRNGEGKVVEEDISLWDAIKGGSYPVGLKVVRNILEREA